MKMSNPVNSVMVAILALVAHAEPTWGAHWYVSPHGHSAARGTRDRPWDIKSAFAGRREIAPGDTIWVRGGSYVGNFESTLAGTANSPVVVRGYPGERATLDGARRADVAALMIKGPYSWYRDLEITNSSPVRVVSDSGSDGPRGDGVDNYAVGTKLIDLVIHDAANGIGHWSTGSKPSNTEVYGCIIYNNGWEGPDRGHGHAIYTQNAEGVKTISDCIMTGGYGYSLHAYGSSRADVNNYLVVGNIVYNADTFLIGGGKPSHGIRVLDNILYGVSMQLGYSAPHNDDCDVRNNMVINSKLSINKFEKVVNEGNVIIGEGGPRPKGTRVILRPNKYDHSRAHLVVINWEKRPEVKVDPGTFLKAGDRYRLLDPKEFFGKPVLTGSADGRPIRLPMKGEFGVFVLIRTNDEK